MKVLVCLFAIFAVSNAGFLKIFNIGIGGGLIGRSDYVAAAPVQSVQYVQTVPVKVVQVIRTQPVVYQTVSAPVYEQPAQQVYQSEPSSSYGISKVVSISKGVY